jgi:predicted outer membrane lipoprotein
MWIKGTMIGCILLTAFVTHTALRIEHLNNLADQFLPRHKDAGAEWIVPELKRVLFVVEDQIAQRRSGAYSVANPDKPMPPEEEFFGPPYTEKEQKMLDGAKLEHAFHSRLRWWVVNFGAIQYVAAPLACVWSIVNLLAVRQKPLRIVSAVCAILAFGSIFLMFLRDY